MKLLFITATNTNIGKTYATLQLIEKLATQRVHIGVCKPIETGVTDIPQDAQLLLSQVQRHNNRFRDFTPKDITAFTFKLPAAPYCADTHHTMSIEKIKTKIAQLSTMCDLLIIEGAGGLMVPITENYFMIDLIQELGTTALLVASSKLGSINDTLLSIQALKSRDIPFDWCVNLFEDRDSFAEVTQPFYDAVFPQWWSLQEGLEAFVEKLIG